MEVPLRFTVPRMAPLLTSARHREPLPWKEQIFHYYFRNIPNFSHKTQNRCLATLVTIPPPTPYSTSRTRYNSTTTLQSGRCGGMLGILRIETCVLQILLKGKCSTMSGQVWGHTPEQRIVASTLRRYSFVFRLAIFRRRYGYL